MSNTKSPDSADNSEGDVGVSAADDVIEASSTSSVESSEAVKPTRVRLMGVVALVIIALDQITKVWAASALVDRDIDLFWTARLHLIRNYGSAFGVGSQLGRWLAVIIVFVIIGVVLYSRTVTNRLMLLLLGGIVGGAIGNLIDRLLRAEDGFMSGGVVDFIDFQWWPVFNVADMAVVVSALGLMVLSLREPE